ncbi:MAG: PAS domain S-box protein [Limibaculum sp.]
MTALLGTRRYRLPLITILVFSVSLLAGFGKLFEESRRSQDDIQELLYWSASQTVVEYWRLMGALDLYAGDAADGRLDEVLLRLDILWSRINVYGEGDVGRQLRGVEDSEPTIAALAQMLSEIEPALRDFDAGDKRAITSLRERLASHASPLHRLAQQTNLHEQARAIDFRMDTARTYWLLLALLLGILLSGMLLIVLLFREIKVTNESLQAANAAETRTQSVAERLSAVLNSSVVGIITIDGRGTITSFNPSAEKLLGYTARDVVSRNISMLVPEPHHAAHDGYLARYQETGEARFVGQAREVMARCADGTALPVEISVGVMDFGGTTSFVGFVVDISERKQAENALKASEQRFRDVAEIAGDWIWETDREDRYIYFSDQMEKVTGLRAKDILGKTRRILPWAKADHPKWQRHYETIEARQPFREFSFEIHGPGIETRHVRISGKPIFDTDGEFDGYRGTGTDVTAQVEAEAEAARKTALLHVTFDNMAEGINVVDGNGNIAAFNSRFLQLFELPARTVVVGKPFEQLVRFNAERGEYGPGDTEELARRRLELRQPGRSQLDEHTRPDGTIIERRTSPLPDGGFVTTYVDITDRKRIEDESRQAQKMEAVGRLTAGVAHEFNNLLAAIGGFAHLVKRHSGDPDTVDEWIEDIITAADQGATLTRQLLNFSHSQAPNPVLVPIGTILSETEALLRPTIGELITTKFDIADEQALVRIDPDRLSQALINLVINAKDVMPDGGMLTLASRVTDLDSTATAGFDSAKAGRYVMISVTDTGTGIDADTMEKIFEPFFTTKEVGEGTGLGLSMVYGMVQQSGGVITTESEVGRGTTFTIYLPLAEESALAAEASAETGTVPHGSETVLLAEDDAAVQQLARITLEGLGYTVLTTNDGMKAVEIFQDHKGPIELLLVDLRMPGLDGRTLARMLTAESPSLRVLYIASYDEPNQKTRCGPADDAVVLTKPFDPDELAWLVRGVLDKTDRPNAA